MSLEGKTSFLRDKDQAVYLNNILRRSIDATKIAIKDNCQLMEIEFLPNRKNDLSVTETLDTTRDYCYEYLKAFKEYGQDLWIAFPDSNELQLARKVWGENNFFTMTSIEGAIRRKDSEAPPKLLIAISPGFNIDEWIELAKWDTTKVPLIVINGNLDRLRQGYYPSIFYPGLTKVSKSFYSKFSQVFFLQPVSISGDRYAGYTARVYPKQWEILLKSDSNYEVIKSSEQQEKAKVVFDLLSKQYKEKYNKLF